MQEVTPTNPSSQEPTVTPPATPSAEPEIPQTPVTQVMEVPDDEKLFSTLCYIPVLSIIFAPYAVSKYPKSDFVNLHAAQGLGLFALWFISMVVISLIPWLGGIVWLILILLSVYGGLNAWGGKATSLPFVKQLGEKFLSWLKGFLLTTGKNVLSGMNQAVNQDVADKATPDVAPPVTPDATTQPSTETQPPTTPTPTAPSSDVENK